MIFATIGKYTVAALLALIASFAIYAVFRWLGFEFEVGSYWLGFVVSMASRAILSGVTK